MWRWQSIQEFQYPITEYLAALRNQPVFMGLESVVAGHEHSSMSVISGQLPTGVYDQTLPTTPGYTPLGNATALAKWTYCAWRRATRRFARRVIFKALSVRGRECETTDSR